jgi:hypothetical protein
MHDRRKTSAFILALLLAAPALIAAEPIPRVLDQAKLDHFLAEVDLLTSDPDIAAAWNSAGNAAAQEVALDPNSGISGENVIGMVYSILRRTSLIAKRDVPATAALKRHGWTPEFWDIYVVLLIGTHYASVADINASMPSADAAGPGPQGKLPPIERFIHPDDYKLVVANYQRIFKLVGKEIEEQNGTEEGDTE